MKTCIKCGEARPFDYFPRDASRKDGYFPYCKVCQSKNPERWLERQRMKEAGKKRCPDCEKWFLPEAFYTNAGAKDGLSSQCKECMRKRAREHGRKNPRRKSKDQAAADWRRYYERHRERLVQRAIAYSRTPAGRASQARKNHLRRLREQLAPATLTDSEWKEIIAEQQNRCLDCGREFSEVFPPTRDHIIPVSKGGGLTRDNVAARCRSCNSAKSDRLEMPPFVETGD